MSESNTNPAAADDDEWANFDLRAFVDATLKSQRWDDESNAITEERITRLEEIVAARWPRSMFLRRRLAREIRASVDSWDDSYIPRGDFRARRGEAVMQQAILRPEERRRRHAERLAEQQRQAAEADPGEGFLP